MNNAIFVSQILCTYDSISEIDVEAVSKFVASLQQPDGSFFGDQWGEVDTRFSFCAVAILSLLVSSRLLNRNSAKNSISFTGQYNGNQYGQGR